MPIEFRCSRCGKLLRTGDDTGGRQAQCPGCGTISTVPDPSAPLSDASVPPLAPLNAGSPFSAGPIAAAANPENPYQSPSDVALVAEQRVQGPAIALIVTGIVGLLGSLGLTVVFGISLAMALTGHVQPFNQPQHDATELAFGFSVYVVAGVVGLVLNSVILFGAAKMKKLESYGLSLAAAIIAVIPCLSPCCLLGVPFGIWAIVVLSDSSVKASFRR
jgi:hypothetical protein